MHPPHKKNVLPPVANPIEQGCKREHANISSNMGEIETELHSIQNRTEGKTDVTVPCGTHRCNNFQEFQRASLEDTQFE